jgi:hypothetical protein
VSTDAPSQYHEDTVRFWEREIFLEGLRERERKLLHSFGDCTCAEAPMCPWFRRPGDLFANGLPQDLRLP